MWWKLSHGGMRSLKFESHGYGVNAIAQIGGGTIELVA